MTDVVSLLRPKQKKYDLPSSTLEVGGDKREVFVLELGPVKIFSQMRSRQNGILTMIRSYRTTEECRYRSYAIGWEYHAFSYHVAYWAHRLP
jgi:hypothetical protein